MSIAETLEKINALAELLPKYHDNTLANVSVATCALVKSVHADITAMHQPSNPAFQFPVNDNTQFNQDYINRLRHEFMAACIVIMLLTSVQYEQAKQNITETFGLDTWQGRLLDLVVAIEVALTKADQLNNPQQQISYRLGFFTEKLTVPRAKQEAQALFASGTLTGLPNALDEFLDKVNQYCSAQAAPPPEHPGYQTTCRPH